MIFRMLTQTTMFYKDDSGEMLITESRMYKEIGSTFSCSGKPTAKLGQIMQSNA